MGHFRHKVYKETKYTPHITFLRQVRNNRRHKPEAIKHFKTHEFPQEN